MDETTIAADGEHTRRGRPLGFTALTPFIVVADAAAAIEFYTAVFGATLISRMDSPGPDGTPVVAHAELDFGAGRLQLGDPNPAFGLVAAPAAEGVFQSIAVYCADADAVVARAAEHGATVVEPPATFVSGDRYGAILDPFGRRWTVMTRVEDLSPEESERRVADWLASLG